MPTEPPTHHRAAIGAFPVPAAESLVELKDLQLDLDALGDTIRDGRAALTKDDLALLCVIDIWAQRRQEPDRSYSHSLPSETDNFFGEALRALANA